MREPFSPQELASIRQDVKLQAEGMEGDYWPEVVLRLVDIAEGPATGLLSEEQAYEAWAATRPAPDLSQARTVMEILEVGIHAAFRAGYRSAIADSVRSPSVSNGDGQPEVTDGCEDE